MRLRRHGRDEPRVLLLPAATAAKLDLVYVHDAMMLLFYTLFLSQCDVNSFTHSRIWHGAADSECPLFGR
jgi:hypothetical protein